MSMKVGRLPVVNPFNLCMVVVGGSARNLKSHGIKGTCEEDRMKISLEELSVSESGCRIRFRQGLQHW